MTKKIAIGQVTVGGGTPLVLIAGPCVIEGAERTLQIGRQIREITNRLGIPYIFKASFDKANRSSFHAFRGPGLTEGLQLLAQIKQELGTPVLSDIHDVSQASPAAAVLNVLQIPAFLCRQTDLLVAAAKTDKIVNIKKAQFLAGNDMGHPCKKVTDSGNDKVILTERGTMLGYGNLVVDYRNLVDMAQFGFPVVMDVTHAVQKPGGLGGKSGGDRGYVPYLAKAAAAVGVDGFFFETHEDPENALSDGPNMVTPDKLEEILKSIIDIRTAIGK